MNLFQLAAGVPPSQVPYLTAAGAGKAPYVETTPTLAPTPATQSGRIYTPPAMINPAEITDMQASQPVQTSFPPAQTGFSQAQNSLPSIPLISGPVPAAPTFRVRPVYPTQPQAATLAYVNPPGMGMDPTAPVDIVKPVAPPPMSGFVRK